MSLVLYVYLEIVENQIWTVANVVKGELHPAVAEAIYRLLLLCVALLIQYWSFLRNGFVVRHKTIGAIMLGLSYWIFLRALTVEGVFQAYGFLD
jgi:hypothetical protein